MGASNEAFIQLLNQLAVTTSGSAIMGGPGSELVRSMTAEVEEMKRQPVTLESLKWFKKHVVGGKLKITEENMEVILDANPEAFVGIELEVIDPDDDDYFEESE